MPRYKFIKAWDEEEDEDELTPSQKAKIEQKKKYQFITPFEEKFAPEKPKPTIKEKPPEKEPSLIKRVAKGIKEFLIGKKRDVTRKEFLIGKKEEPVEKEIRIPEELYVALIPNVEQRKVNAQADLYRTERELINLRLKLPKIRQTRTVEAENKLEDKVFALEETIEGYDNFLTREPARRGLLQQILHKVKDPIDLLNLEKLKETAVKRQEVEAMKKYERGEALTDEEMVFFNLFRSKTLDSYVKQGLGTMVGEVITEMPSYIMEIAVFSKLAGAPGTYTQIGQGFSNLTKLSSPVARDIVNKVLTNSVRKAVGSRLDIPGIRESTAEYMLPTYEIQMDSEGKDFLKLVKPGFDEEAALSKAYASKLVEYVSEGIGSYIDDAIPFVKKLFISKWLKNNNITTGTATKILRKMNFNSIVGEVLEEEIAEPIQAIIDEREYKDPFFTPEGRERLLVETLGIAGFSGIAKVSDTTEKLLTKRRQEMPGDMLDLKAEPEIEEEPEEEPEVPEVIKKKKKPPVKKPVEVEEPEVEKPVKPEKRLKPIDVKKVKVEPSIFVEVSPTETLETKTPSGLADLWSEAQEKIDVTRKPLETRLKQAKEELNAVKGRTKETVEKRKTLRKEIESLGEKISEIEGRVEEESMEFGIKLAVEAMKEAQKMGLDLGKIGDGLETVSEGWSEFRDEFLMTVTDRPGIEHYWDVPLKEVIREMVMERGIKVKKLPVKKKPVKIEPTEEEYRVTPKGQKTVPQIVKVGDIVRTSYGTGPYRVEKITGPYKQHYDAAKGQQVKAPESYSFVLSDVDAKRTKEGKLPKNYSYSYINELVAVDDRLLALFMANEDEVFIEGKPKKPPVKKLPVKPKPVAKPKPVKPKAIKPKEIVKPKAKIFKAQERKQIQKKTKEVAFSGKDQPEAVKNVNNYVKEVLNQGDDPLFIRKIKAVRAELKRSMYEIAGADTGQWKKDYALFHTLRRDPSVADIVDELEEGIFSIDEAVKPAVVPATIGYATTESKPISEFEDRKSPKEGTSEFKLFEETKTLIRKYARLVGEDYTPRGALGVYYKETKNIMVNALNDLSVVAHEITHFLDETYKISDKLLAIKGFSANGNPIYDPRTLKYRKSITDLYVKYYGGGRDTHKLRKRVLEGFATLLQKYVESPQAITEEYPLLVNSFLKEGGEYYQPVMKEIIEDLNKIVEKYQGLSSLDKIGSRITSEDVSADKTDFLNFFEKLRTQLVDAIYPVEVLAKRAKVHFTVDDPSLWLRAYNSVSGIINNNIASDRGYWSLKGEGIVKKHDFNWKTLVDTVEERRATNDFAYYLVARREHFAYLELDQMEEKVRALNKQVGGMTRKEAEDTINSETGQSLFDEQKEAIDNYKELKMILTKDGFARSDVDEAYLENKKRFVKEEKMFDALTREDLKFLGSKEVQLIKPEELERLLSKQGYASFKRQFYNELLGENNEMPSQVRVGKTRVSSLLRRKGSMKTIINPVYSGIANHSEAMRKGLRQVVYNKITTIGISAAFPDIFQDLQLKVAVDKESGIFHYPQEKDPNIIMGRVDYKRKPILVDKQVKNIIDDILTYQNIEVFTRLYAGLSRMFTAGTTGFYPSFAVTNLLRDQITAQANTTNKYKSLYSPLVQFGKLLADKSSQDYEYYQEYMVMGGERQTFTGWQKLPPNKLFQRIKGEKKGLEKAIGLMEKGTDFLSAPAKYSELVTRASEYILARKAGKPPIVALEEAGRLTAPFHHLGKWGGAKGRVFIRGLPFFNATLQVLDQTLRTAGTKGGRQRMSFVTLAITAAYLTSLMALLRADDEQKEQYKDLEGRELATNIYFPHPSGKKLIRLPMSDVFSSLGTIINMIIADNVMKTRYKSSDYMAAATSIIPDQFNLTEPINMFLSWIPQIFQAGAETAMGIKTWPKIQPLESMALKNMPPGMRTNENTSIFAKWLGEKANLSPIKVDYLLTGYFGRAIGFVTGKPSAYDFQSSVIRDYYFSYGRRISGTYDLKKENDQIYTVYQRGEKELSESEAREVYRIKVLTTDFTDAMRDYRKADIEEDEKEASLLRSEVLTLINQIDLKEEPKGFRKWVQDAEKRRRKKIKETEKESKKRSGLLPKDFLSLNIFKPKPAYAAEKKEENSPYRIEYVGIDRETKEEMVKFYYPSGASSLIKVRDVPLYGALTQEHFSMFNVGEYPKDATDWLATQEKPKKVTVKTDSALPSKKEKEVDVYPTTHDDKIEEVFGEDSDNAKRILNWGKGAGEGENQGYITGEGWVNEETGEHGDYNYETDKDGNPILDKDGKKKPKHVVNLEGKLEISQDRGLYRIHNGTFYDFMKRKKERLNENDIYSYEDMYDPEKNIRMAEIIFDEQGWCAWYAAPDDLVKHCSWYEKVRGKK